MVVIRCWAEYTGRMIKKTLSFSAALAMLTVTLSIAMMIGLLQVRQTTMKLRSDVAILRAKDVVSTGAQPVPIPLALSHSTTTSRGTRSIGYSVHGGALLEPSAGAAVSDLAAAGLKLAECGSMEDVSVYLEMEKSGVLLMEGCGAIGGAMWKYDFFTERVTRRAVSYSFGGVGTESFDKRYQLVFGAPDDDGEIRSLVVKDFVQDRSFVTAKLGRGYSYISSYSEFDGGPVGNIRPMALNSQPQWFEADVYDAGAPVQSYMDSRKPLLTKAVATIDPEA